jgi:hypothetical protein
MSDADIIPSALAAFHDAMAAAYYISDAPTATVTAYAAALTSIQAPPELDSAGETQLPRLPSFWLGELLFDAAAVE